MLKRGIMLLPLAVLLSVLLAGPALGGVAVIPASQDVYISMGGDRVSVYNQTDYLLCAVDVAEENGTSVYTYPGEPVIQFDISGVNISEDDVVVLVLKAEAMQASEDPVMVVLLTVGSEWDEASDFTTFLVNINSARNKLNKNDLTIMSSDVDGDLIFAFDVSEKLLDARKEGKISFLLQPKSNSSSEITFLSRESGEGPALLIMPYPQTSENAEAAAEGAAEAAVEAQEGGAAEISTENLSAPAGGRELQNISTSGGSTSPLVFQKLLPTLPDAASGPSEDLNKSREAQEEDEEDAAGPLIVADSGEARLGLLM